ncbi:MAG: hypothetical protein K2X35_15635 [Bryobacteraceae bacterium]|nr:hypothetical protein [Bryobacteraceae bacterium]
MRPKWLLLAGALATPAVLIVPLLLGRLSWDAILWRAFDVVLETAPTGVWGLFAAAFPLGPGFYVLISAAALYRVLECFDKSADAWWIAAHLTGAALYLLAILVQARRRKASASTSAPAA